MKKINILKKSTDFSRIIKKNKAFVYKDYIIYIERVDNSQYHFGISVSKKLGNAVVRNKIKRQIKNIIDKKDYQNNFNCIIIVRKGILLKKYDDMEKEIYEAFKKLNIYKEEIDEK